LSRRSVPSCRCTAAASSTKARCSLFAKAYKYEESIAGALGDVGREDRNTGPLISGDRYDPILIVSKVIGWSGRPCVR
jgi:hypothetical protein